NNIKHFVYATIFINHVCLYAVKYCTKLVGNNAKCKEEMRSEYVSSKFTLNSHKILKMGKTIVLTGAGGVLC
mgnify:CR=1